MKRLELLRRSRGFSQQDLSAATGVARTRISELECGRFIPSTGSKDLTRLATVLGVSPAQARSILEEVDVDGR